MGSAVSLEGRKKESNRGIERARNETAMGRKTLEKKERRNNNEKARETQYTNDGASVCRKAVGRERKHTNTEEGLSGLDHLPDAARRGSIDVGVKAIETSILHASRAEGKREVEADCGTGADQRRDDDEGKRRLR